MAWFKRNPRAILTPPKSNPTIGMNGLNRDRYTDTGDYTPQSGIVGPQAAKPEEPQTEATIPEPPGENCEWVCSGPDSPGGGSINDKRAPSIGRKAPRPYKLKPLKRI